MSITLELTPEEEALLRTVAAAQGQDVSAFIKTSALTTARNRADHGEPFRFPLWHQMERLGHEAGDAARAELRGKGISAPFLREGRLYEELPDGTVRPVGDALVPTTGE